MSKKLTIEKKTVMLSVRACFLVRGSEYRMARLPLCGKRSFLAFKVIKLSNKKRKNTYRVESQGAVLAAWGPKEQSGEGDQIRFSEIILKSVGLPDTNILRLKKA